MTRGRSQPVLAAKTRVPPPKGLARERLARALAPLWHHRLGLIVAPAGSGKTTLLTHVAAALSAPVAWYRAEAADATEGVLVAHLERALTAGLDELRGQWDSIDDAVAALEEWQGERALLVVDDLHEIRGTEAEGALERLACNLPPAVAMLVATRRVPGFNLSRLRVSGELLELGPEELRFRSWEVEGLFRNVYREPLPPEELAELARRTEGWAAGLQLFHLATRGKSAADRRRVLRELGMRSRLVREYLARNVLDELDAELRRFLLDTCVLGRLTAPLCDELRRGGDSARLLDELDQRQIFTQPLDEEGAYRYHEVLRSHLEAVLLEQVGEAEAANRYRRAGALLESSGHHPEALRAYCRAEDWEAATRLLGGRGEQVLGGRWGWLDALPSSLVEHDPRLLLVSARRWTASGQWEQAARAYQRAEAGFGPGQGAEACRRELRALVGWLEPLPVAAGDWTGLVRTAVRRDPLVARDAALRDRGSAAALAAGLAALVAGHVRDAGRLLGDVGRDPDASPALTVGAELAGAVAALLAGAAPSPSLEEVCEKAEEAGLPWLAGLARSALALVPGSERNGGLAASDHVSDAWGRALNDLLGGLGAVRTGGHPVDALGEAATAFRALGAGTLEAWARAAQALALARRDGPACLDAVRSAEHLARAVGAPGALAMASAGLALVEPERAEEHLAVVTRTGQETGLDVTGLLPPPAPAAEVAGDAERAGAPGRPPLLGRQRELAELARSVDAAFAGSGQLVELTGESGVGKTRLAEEVAAYAQGRSARVVWGRCAERAAPYWPWAQLMREHILSCDLRRLSAELGRDARALASIVPELEELLPDGDVGSAGSGDGAPPPDSAASRFALFEAARGLLERAARERPLVVVLDDLHLADMASLQLLQFLARALASCPVLIVATYRDSEAGGAAVAGILAPFSSARRFRLGGLGEGEVAQLMAAVAGRAPRPALVTAVLAKSDGNPFFVQETTRLLMAERGYDDPAIVSADQLRLPASVRETAARRLAELSEGCRDALATAAVIGRSFTLAVLERASGIGAEELLEVIGEAVAGRVVEEAWAAAPRFRFCHGLIQEGLYAQLSPAERAWRHRRVGEAVEAAAGAYVEPHLDELAHHFVRAGRSGDPRRAVRYAIGAARAALRNAAPEQAVSGCQVAMELLGGDEDSALRGELLAVLSAARAHRDTTGEEPAPSTPPAVTVRCFGGFSLSLGGQPLDVAGVKPRHRSVLHLLALRAGRAIHREQLVETFWPDDADGKAGTRNLQVAISALRQLLEPGVARGAASIVVRDGDTYRLSVGDDVDVLIFERSVEEGARARGAGDAARAESAFARALDVYAGDLLPDAGPAEWALKEREHYRLEAAGAAQALAELRLERGDPSSALWAAERGLRIDPYWDGLWRLLVRACEEAGDVAAAERARAQYRHVLADLGLATAE